MNNDGNLWFWKSDRYYAFKRSILWVKGMEGGRKREGIQENYELQAREQHSESVHLTIWENY